MKITPLDIRQKRFASGFRGCDRREVEGYLELLAAEFEDVVKENIALKDELKRLQSRIDQYAERERTLQETMVTAQRISEDLKDAAKKEAEIILADAENQAEKVVQNAHHRLVKVMDDLAELKRQKIQFEAQVRASVEAHLKLLESFTTPEEKVPENLAFLPSKRASAD